MSAAFEKNLFLDQGSDYNLIIALENEAGEPVENVEECFFYARPHYNSHRITALRAFFADSVLTVNATAAETMEFIPGKYVYTLEYKDTSGETLTLLRGILTIRETMRPRVINS